MRCDDVLVCWSTMRRNAARRAMTCGSAATQPVRSPEVTVFENVDRYITYPAFSMPASGTGRAVPSCPSYHSSP